MVFSITAKPSILSPSVASSQTTICQCPPPYSKVDSFLSLKENPVCVCVGGAASQPQSVISGVPRGSMLGLLLFNFYINDISLLQLAAGTMSLYADDVMLYL